LYVLTVALKLQIKVVIITIYIVFAVFNLWNKGDKFITIYANGLINIYVNVPISIYANQLISIYANYIIFAIYTTLYNTICIDAN